MTKTREEKLAYQRKWYAENREHARAKQREYYQANKERIKEKTAEWAARNPERIRRYAAKKNATRQSLRVQARISGNGFRYSDEYYRQERLRQKIRKAGRAPGDSCECCGSPFSGSHQRHFDHCHGSGKFRGWICGKCNVMVAMARDDPKVLEAGAAYLRRFGAL